MTCPVEIRRTKAKLTKILRIPVASTISPNVAPSCLDRRKPRISLARLIIPPCISDLVMIDGCQRRPEIPTVEGFDSAIGRGPLGLADPAAQIEITVPSEWLDAQ